MASNVFFKKSKGFHLLRVISVMNTNTDIRMHVNTKQKIYKCQSNVHNHCAAPVQ